MIPDARITPLWQLVKFLVSLVMRYPDIPADAHDEGYLFFLEKLDDIFRPGEPSVKNEHRFLRCERQSAVIHPLAEILNELVMTFIA